MEDIKKSLAFYCCSNGIGHFKRVTEISRYLTQECNVTIYCTKLQVDKIGKVENVNYILYTLNNIDWAKLLNNEQDEMYKEYFNWLALYGPTVTEYDIVVSDNIVGLIQYREDIIIQGSFLWKDVLLSKIGTNEITTQDEFLLNKFNPPLITNKYVETQSVKSYSNKIQFGFGFESQRMIFSKIEKNLVNTSSLKYLKSYSNFIGKLKTEHNLAFSDNFSYINNVRMFARPGVGTITHCMEYNIPLIALYDENDSQEIIELAQSVEDLKLGFKQDVNQPFNLLKFKEMASNTGRLYGSKVELEGYKKIAEYIKKL